MLKFCLIILRILTLTASSSASNLSFPAGFKFGAGTSAYQIEGAWNVSDKSESIWDRFTLDHPDKIFDGSNADVAADSYRLWRRDVEIAEELGLDFYRFSISWTRILPNAFASKISEEGKRYYDDLINLLIEKGIEPIVTINHFDLPQCLQDLGGWSNPLIADWYSEYARVLFQLYGDRVKRWLTLNEPLIYCAGYTMDLLPPNVINEDLGYYLCIKHSLLAHAKAYRVYDEEFRSKYKGKVSVGEMMFWLEPSSPEVDDLTELAREYFLALFFDPIFSQEGGYPPKVEEAVAKQSKAEGYNQSKLPAFTEHEKELIRGDGTIPIPNRERPKTLNPGPAWLVMASKSSADFITINYYTARLVKELQPGDFALFPMFGASDIGVKFTWELEDARYQKSSSVWMQIYPKGIRKLMRWLRDRYGDVEIFIAESGFSTEGDLTNDFARIDSINGHLEQILLAIKEDNINVSAFTVWSLIDVFEWIEGFRVNFGLYKVDFNSTARTRTPRLSAKYYADVISSRSLDIIGAYSCGLRDEL